MKSQLLVIFLLQTQWRTAWNGQKKYLIFKFYAHGVIFSANLLTSVISNLIRSIHLKYILIIQSHTCKLFSSMIWFGL